MKNILISTGGSGGHVVPAKILSEHLHSNFNVFISTDSRGLKYLDNEKNDIILINTPKLNLNIFFIFKKTSFKKYYYSCFSMYFRSMVSF